MYITQSSTESSDSDCHQGLVGFPGGSAVKNPPAMQEIQQETWVWFLGQKNSPEKKMATHLSILAWKIPWAESGGLQSVESQRVGHD